MLYYLMGWVEIFTFVVFVVKMKKIKGLVKRFKQNEAQFTALIEMLTEKINSCDQSQYIKGVK